MILIFQVSNTYQPKTTKTANNKFFFQPLRKNPRKFFAVHSPLQKIHGMFPFFLSNKESTHSTNISLVQKMALNPEHRSDGTTTPSPSGRCFSNVSARAVALLSTARPAKAWRSPWAPRRSYDFQSLQRPNSRWRNRRIIGKSPMEEADGSKGTRDFFTVSFYLPGWWQLKDFWNFHPENWGNDLI